jgi:hypothetical protein
LLALSGSLLAQASLNMTFLGNFGKGEGEIRAVFAAGSLVYYGVGNKVQITSFSDPANPLKVAAVELNNLVEDVVRTSISGAQHLVVVGGSELSLVNVQNPTTPAVSANVTLENGGFGEGVATSGTYGFVAAGGAGLLIYDISDPANPSFVVGVDSLQYCEGINIATPYAYLAAGNRTHIVDISDPTAPVYAGRIPEISGYHQDVNVISGHAYVCDFENGIHVVDVTNPSSPNEVTFVPLNFGVADILFDGNFAYVANRAFGLQILDITTPSAPTLGALFDTQGTLRKVAFGAITISGTPTGHIFGADVTAIRAINVSTPATPVESGAITVSAAVPGSAFSTFLDGDKAYVAYGSAGIRILDIANPANVTQLGEFNTPGDARKVVVKDDVAFVADRDAGVRVIDVSNPASPTEITSFSTPRARDIAISGDYVFAAVSDSGLAIFDATNAASPTLVTFAKQAYGEGVAAFGNIAAASTYGKIVFYDVTNPTQPDSVNEIAQSFGTGEFSIDANFAYVHDFDTLRVISISDLNNVFQVGKAFTDGSFDGTAVVDGQYCYVNSEEDGVRVFDLSDPANPIEVGFYDGAAIARGVSARNGLGYVAERADGLSIYRNDLVTSVNDGGTVRPVAFTLRQNYPNPFNPSTTINYTIPQSAQPNQVRLEIYNLMGQKVRSLVNEKQTTGAYKVDWDGQNEQGVVMPSGAYIYRLTVGEQALARRMLFLK